MIDFLITCRERQFSLLINLCYKSLLAAVIKKSSLTDESSCFTPFLATKEQAVILLNKPKLCFNFVTQKALQ